MANAQKYTTEGFKKLKDEYEYLTKTRREEVKNAIAEARSFGDLSENSEYDEAKQAQYDNENEITRLEEMLKNVEFIDESNKNTDEVRMGLVVSLKNKNTGKVADYYVVGSSEANPFEKKISNESPLGRALLGQKVGASVEVAAPAGTVVYEIVEIKTQDN
jgi:transcription elongation factor GreA